MLSYTVAPYNCQQYYTTLSYIPLANEDANVWFSCHCESRSDEAQIGRIADWTKYIPVFCSASRLRRSKFVPDKFLEREATRRESLQGRNGNSQRMRWPVERSTHGCVGLGFSACQDDLSRKGMLTVKAVANANLSGTITGEVIAVAIICCSPKNWLSRGRAR